MAYTLRAETREWLQVRESAICQERAIRYKCGLSVVYGGRRTCLAFVRGQRCLELVVCASEQSRRVIFVRYSWLMIFPLFSLCSSRRVAFVRWKGGKYEDTRALDITSCCEIINRKCFFKTRATVKVGKWVSPEAEIACGIFHVSNLMPLLNETGLCVFLICVSSIMTSIPLSHSLFLRQDPLGFVGQVKGRERARGEGGGGREGQVAASRNVLRASSRVQRRCLYQENTHVTCPVPDRACQKTLCCRMERCKSSWYSPSSHSHVLRPRECQVEGNPAVVHVVLLDAVNRNLKNVYKLIDFVS